jgi:hypothetical protein
MSMKIVTFALYNPGTSLRKFQPKFTSEKFTMAKRASRRISQTVSQETENVNRKPSNQGA